MSIDANIRAHTAQDTVEAFDLLTRAGLTDHRCPCGKSDPGICGGCPEDQHLHCRCRHTRSSAHKPMHDDRFNIVRTAPDDQPPEHDPARPWVVIHPRTGTTPRRIERFHRYRAAVAHVAAQLDGWTDR